MGSAGVLVFPSNWYETFGRVAIESFAAGTPVVASRIGAIAEVCGEGDAGLLFEPGNAADLAQKLRSALGNPIALQAMRSAARSAYETRFTMQENCRALIAAYEVAQMAARAVGKRAGQSRDSRVEQVAS
jgi:glycosyltransferase involved in cell wall biosynthesis